MWIEEYESMAALEAMPHTSACTEAWAPIYELATPGTFLAGIWRDELTKEAWLQR
jgi:hypothetical protein